MSRLYKSYFQTAIDNCFTLFERDISNSCNERIIFKDSAHIACYSLKRLAGVIKDLQLLTENADNNCKKFMNKVASQELMKNLILEGKSRKNAHDLAQLKAK